MSGTDYFTEAKLGLDVAELEVSCYQLYDLIVENFSDGSKAHYGVESTRTTLLYSDYNLLMYPWPQIHGLYEGIRKTFRQRVPNGEYFIACWLNIYKGDQSIPWHGHWLANRGVYHGVYCLRGEGSITSYRNLPDGRPDIDVVNHVDHVCISPSDGHEHRSHPWTGEGDRITIAFDIVPAKNIDWGLNHWIPL
jgi:hypothetical protein